MMVFVLGLVIIFGAAMIVCVPVLRAAPSEAQPVESSDAAERWEKQKRDAYRAIKEAELDFQMGKLAPDDYRAIRTAEEAKALDALRALDDEASRAGNRKRG